MIKQELSIRKHAQLFDILGEGYRSMKYHLFLKYEDEQNSFSQKLLRNKLSCKNLKNILNTKGRIDYDPEHMCEVST